VQCAALPYRLSPHLEILLVTSRETGRWIIPKGWTMKLKTRREAAAIEALEEAGVEGKISKEPLGGYDYMKTLKSGEAQLCRVAVFSLEVTSQREIWREQDQRTTQWFGWMDAAAVVSEPGLAEIIRELAHIHGQPAAPATKR
jgi:8-oxo-dGTP pyrophosphatase MutT (NUDIX family)